MVARESGAFTHFTTRSKQIEVRQDLTSSPHISDTKSTRFDVVAPLDPVQMPARAGEQFAELFDFGRFELGEVGGHRRLLARARSS